MDFVKSYFGTKIDQLFSQELNYVVVIIFFIPSWQASGNLTYDFRPMNEKRPFYLKLWLT